MHEHITLLPPGAPTLVMDLLLHHAHTAPVPPSARTELPISATLDRLVLSCLAKNPADRPQSAKELSRRLSDLEVDVWTQERAREWWVSHQPVSR
jgi:serine/threonine protein kinase